MTTLLALASTVVLGRQLAASPTVTVVIDSKAVAARTYSGKMTIDLPESWHVYSNPAGSEYDTATVLSVKNKGFSLSNVNYPKGIKVNETGSTGYEGKFDIKFTLKTNTDLKVGSKVVFNLKYQMCNDRTCIPPTDLQHTLTIAKAITKP